MVIKRQAYKLVILEPAKSRIARGECPSCGKPKSKWKRSTRWYCCSKKCTAKFHKYFYVVGWPDLRNKVFKRDKFTCVNCGTKPTKEYESFSSGKTESYPDYSKLIADHIKPISLGGEQWDPINVQTLCIQCNKIKTKKDAGDIAKERRINRKLSKGQKQLQEFVC